MWIAVDRCEQGIISPKKDHFMADTGYCGGCLIKNKALNQK
jgi:hypothetical protein